MTQETRVILLTPSQGDELRRRLDAAGFRFRSIPHARFAAVDDELSATLYKSGKLVLQGRGLELFAERFLGLQPAAPPHSRVDDERIGTDEAGKGDYYGPLVVAAVYCSDGDIARLRRIGVADSKQLSDGTVARIAAAVQVSTTNEVVALSPVEYNRRYAETRNVNALLGELHAFVITKIASATRCRRVLIDQFGDIAHVRAGLAERAAAFELETRPRAEEHVAVAAASILARDAFLRGLRELSDQFAVDLPKGAGEPVDRAAERVLAVLGRDGLGNVAKLHFKNTDRIFARFRASR